MLNYQIPFLSLLHALQILLNFFQASCMSFSAVLVATLMRYLSHLSLSILWWVDFFKIIGFVIFTTVELERTFFNCWQNLCQVWEKIRPYSISGVIWSLYYIHITPEHRRLILLLNTWFDLASEVNLALITINKVKPRGPENRLFGIKEFAYLRI